MRKSWAMSANGSWTLMRSFVVFGGIAAGVHPAAAEDLADRFPNLKMPILAAVDEPADDAGEPSQASQPLPSGDLAPLLANLDSSRSILGSTVIANYDSPPRLPGDRDFAAIVDEARREASGLASLGSSSVARGIAHASTNGGGTAASFASHRKPHCRAGAQACPQHACPPQPCPPAPHRGGSGIAEYPSTTDSSTQPQPPSSIVPQPPAAVPAPGAMQADAPVALPDVERQLPRLARADVGATRETWSDTPYLVGDGCAPGGGGGQASIGQLAIVAQGLDSSGYSPNSANIYLMNPAYGQVQNIQPGYPGFNPLAAPTQQLNGSVSGPQSLSLGPTSSGITAVQTPSGIYTGAAQQAFENQTNSPPLQTAQYPNGTAIYQPQLSGALQSGTNSYDAFLYYNYFVPASVVLPGYAVGFVKLTENMSPIPRDRVYMNYSYFKNANFFDTRADVNRFMPGFEKTFYDGWTSIEVRTPFAATLDATQYLSPTQDFSGGSGVSQYRDIEFGNMSVIFKTLIWEQNTWAITGGMQVMLPTAANSSAYASIDGTSNTPLFQSVFVANESVHVMPFVGSVWAPNDRFFNQALLQIDTDCNGNLCYVNPTANPNVTGRQLTQIGRAYYPTFMYLSFGTGYWLYKDDSARFTGFSPILEIHVNQAFNAFQPVCSNGYELGINQGIVSVTNALMGCNFEWGTRSTLTFGYVTPIGGGVDRFFDGEVRALYNWRFGPQNSLRRAQF